MLLIAIILLVWGLWARFLFEPWKRMRVKRFGSQAFSKWALSEGYARAVRITGNIGLLAGIVLFAVYFGSLNFHLN